MMKRATRHFVILAPRRRCLSLVAAGFAIATVRNRDRAHNTLETARHADFAQLARACSPMLSSNLPYLRSTLERLEKASGSSTQDRRGGHPRALPRSADA